MLNETLYSMRPFVRYSRYVTTGDYKKFNSVICGFDNRLFYCKKGYGKFVIDNTEYSVSRGVFAIIPSGVGYLYIPNEEDPMELLALNFDYDRETPEKNNDFDILHRTDSDTSREEGAF